MKYDEWIRFTKRNKEKKTSLVHCNEGMGSNGLTTLKKSTTSMYWHLTSQYCFCDADIFLRASGGIKSVLWSYRGSPGLFPLASLILEGWSHSNLLAISESSRYFFSPSKSWRNFTLLVAFDLEKPLFCSKLQISSCNLFNRGTEGRMPGVSGPRTSMSSVPTTNGHPSLSCFVVPLVWQILCLPICLEVKFPSSNSFCDFDLSRTEQILFETLASFLPFCSQYAICGS